MTFSDNRWLKQKATYWAQKKRDGFGGETWVAPIVIACRWEASTDESLSVAYQVPVEIVVSQAVVYTKTRLVVGGYLYLGETTEEDPARLRDAYIIRNTTEVPPLRRGTPEYAAHL